MRILVVGGSGVLGRRTLPRLLAAGHQVTAVARRPESAAHLRSAGVEPIALDVFDAGAATVAAKGMDAVVNIATRIPSPPAAARLAAWRDNDRLRRDASRALAEAAVATGARFIQESFAPTYRDNAAEWIREGQPLDPVAQTRTVPDAEASADHVTASGGTGVVLRFGLFYDSGSADMRRWLDAAAKGVLMLPGPGDRYSSMIYVDDAASAVVAALDLPAGRYNVVEDEPLTRTEHAQVLAGLLDRSRIRPLPAAAARLPVLQALARSHRISNAKLRTAIGWTPTAPSVREGWKMVLADIASERP